MVAQVGYGRDRPQITQITQIYVDGNLRTRPRLGVLALQIGREVAPDLLDNLF